MSKGGACLRMSCRPISILNPDRLPPVVRDELDPEGQQMYDEIVGDARSFVGLHGPGAIRLRAPRSRDSPGPKAITCGSRRVWTRGSRDHHAGDRARTSRSRLRVDQPRTHRAAGRRRAELIEVIRIAGRSTGWASARPPSLPWHAKRSAPTASVRRRSRPHYGCSVRRRSCSTSRSWDTMLRWPACSTFCKPAPGRRGIDAAALAVAVRGRCRSVRVAAVHPDQQDHRPTAIGWPPAALSLTMSTSRNASTSAALS